MRSPRNGAPRSQIAAAYAIRAGVISFGPLVLLASGCGGGMLDPAGPNAARIADLWWIMFGISSAIFLLVLGIMIAALIRSRSRARPVVSELTRERLFVVSAGFIMPLVVLGVLMWLSVSASNAVTDNEAADPSALQVEVIGRQWWWEVRYPEAQVITANEIHIPAGRPVSLTLRSEDVIHSFWVPQLSGKTDLIPGRVNRLNIMAAEPGVFRGQCAEFCGLQHAHMAFLVIAEDPDSFDAWLAAQQIPAGEADEGVLLEGQQVFLGSACVYCHRVSGTSASGTLGPDLTHLMSRRTLAAGTIPNTRGNLAGWILNPQSVKPGTQMPGSNLTAEELHKLLAYLESLE